MRPLVGDTGTLSGLAYQICQLQIQTPSPTMATAFHRSAAQMYSILPSLVSLLFLGYGLRAVLGHGFNRVTGSFFALCLTTFCWQFTWAVLFQIRDPGLALFLVKFGYLLILFLPTTLYHFLTEITCCEDERIYVYSSYGLAAVLAGIHLGSDWLIAGYFEYFWGYYPKAGPIHLLHVIQTVVVVGRGLYITYRRQQVTFSVERSRLRICLVSLFVYLLAAVDYLCNYGMEFYPPGVVFLAISLGMLTAKYRLLSPKSLAASVAHEIRTPLTTIRLGARGLAQHLPILVQGYELAVNHRLCTAEIRSEQLRVLRDLSDNIVREVDRSNLVLETMLSALTLDGFDRNRFKWHSIRVCIDEAVARYPFGPTEQGRVEIVAGDNFEFEGSDTLLVCVLFNLLRNALHALTQAGAGSIRISTVRHRTGNRLIFTDTGTGVPQEIVPSLFRPFHSTKGREGWGVGLVFCDGVMQAFGGRITCLSVPGEYTTFTLEFPCSGWSQERRARE